MTKRITEEQYLTLQSQLVPLSTLILEMPLEDFLNAISRADTLGPILDPTLWMRGSKSMHEIEEVARIFLDAKQKLEKLRNKFLEKLNDRSSP
jgi:hypothetical protein